MLRGSAMGGMPGNGADARSLWVGRVDAVREGVGPEDDVVAGGDADVARTTGSPARSLSLPAQAESAPRPTVARTARVANDRLMADVGIAPTLDQVSKRAGSCRPVSPTR